MTIWQRSGHRTLVVLLEPDRAARVHGGPEGLAKSSAQPQPAEGAPGVIEAAPGSPRSLREQQPVDPGAFSHCQLADVGQVGSKLQPTYSFAQLAGQLATFE